MSRPEDFPKLKRWLRRHAWIWPIVLLLIAGPLYVIQTRQAGAMLTTNQIAFRYAMLIGACLWAIYAAWKLNQRGIKREWVLTGCCGWCGYDLHTIPIDQPCPECGGEQLTLEQFEEVWRNGSKDSSDHRKSP